MPGDAESDLLINETPGFDGSVPSADLFGSRCLIAWVGGVALIVNAAQLGLRVALPGFEAVWYMLDCMLFAIWIVKLFLVLRSADQARWRTVLDFLTCLFLGLYVILVAFQHGDSKDDASPAATEEVGTIVMKASQVLRIVDMSVDLLHSMGDDVETLLWDLLSALAAIKPICMMLAVLLYGSALLLHILVDTETFETGQNPFETLSGSMLTMLNVCVLDEWSGVVRPIAKHQPWLMLFFIAYMVLTSFGVLNLIIGVIVQKTVSAEQDRQEKERLRLVEDVVTRTSKHLLALDQNDDIVSDGCVNYADFIKTYKDLADEETVRKFEEHLVPHGMTMIEVLSLFDIDLSGMVHVGHVNDAFTRAAQQTSFQSALLAAGASARDQQCFQAAWEQYADIKSLLKDVLKEVKEVKEVTAG